MGKLPAEPNAGKSFCGARRECGACHARLSSETAVDQLISVRPGWAPDQYEPAQSDRFRPSHTSHRPHILSRHSRDRIKHRLHVGWRTADNAEYLGGCGLMLQRFGELMPESSLFGRLGELPAQLRHRLRSFNRGHFHGTTGQICCFALRTFFGRRKNQPEIGRGKISSSRLSSLVVDFHLLNLPNPIELRRPTRTSVLSRGDLFRQISRVFRRSAER